MGRIAALLSALFILASAGLLAGQESKPAGQQPPAAEPAKAGQEQPKTPEAAAPQKDSVPITGVVETWLRFEQDGVHRGGYVHEKINLVSGQRWRYDYLYEGDLDISFGTGNDDAQSLHWSWQLTAALMDNFDPYRLEVGATKGDMQWKLEIKPIEDRQHIEISTTAGEGRPEEVIAADVALGEIGGITAPLMLYKLRQRGDLAKPGDVEIHLLAPNGSTSIPLTLKVGEPHSKKYFEDKDQKGGATVTPLTLTSPPPDMPIPVNFIFEIDKYGRIVEAEGAGLRDEDLKFVICKNATEARGAEQILGQRGRRDPFNKKSAFTAIEKGKTGTIAQGTGDQKPPTLRPDNIEKEVENARTMVDDLDRLVKEGNQKAENKYQEFLRHYEVLRGMCKSNPVMLNQLDSLKIRAEQIYGGAEALLKRAKSLMESVEDNYNALNEKGVEDNIRKLRELRSKREFFQDERVIEMDKMIKAAEGKLVQTRARIELSRKALVLTGTVSKWDVVKDQVDFEFVLPGGPVQIHEPVRVLHNLTYAVINNELYREGEEVKGQGVVVEKIQPHGVTVAYKGEVREIGLKKK